MSSRAVSPTLRAGGSSEVTRAPIRDAVVRAVGIPTFGVAIPLAFGLYGGHGLRELVTWLGAVAFVALSWAIWQGNRWLLLRQRTTRDWLEKPARRLGTLLAGIVLYTAPLTALVLGAWERVAGVHVDLRAVVLTNVICVVFVSHAYETVLLIKDRESDALAMARGERVRAEAELLALRRQIDPHFIFNCLNTLQHLVTTDAVRAASFVRDFAGVTRYLLSTSDEHTVTLAEELDLTERYASLLSIRFGDAFRLVVVDEGADRAATLPPTSLQQLVENAAKHNAFHAEKPLVVEIALRPGEIVVTNLRAPREDARVAGTTLGLENLAERVRLCAARPLVIDDSPERFRVTVPLGAPAGEA